MKKRILDICIAVALVAGGYILGHHDLITVVHAQTDTITHGDRFFESTAPKSWGRVVGVAGLQLVFEDANGTIRYFFPGQSQPTNPPNLEYVVTRK